MSFRNLDGNHDWTFGIGKNNYVEGDLEILLNAKTRVLSFLGDCFFAPNEGIDWWNLLEYNKQAQAENDVMATVAQTEGVVEVSDTDSILNSRRQLNLSYGIKTVNGNSYKQNITPIV